MMQAGFRLANVFVPVFQVIISGALLFVSYRYLLRELGAEQLGVWSIALAVSSVSRVGEFGIASGVVKYVAHYLAQNRRRAAAELVQTAVLTMAVFLGGLLALFYPVLGSNLGRFTATSPEIFLVILPEVFLALWLSSVASVFTAALSGCHRVDWSSYLAIVANIVNVAGIFLLVPAYGLLGVAYAQLLQMAFTLVGGVVLLRLALREMPLLPVCWEKGYFRELFSYGTAFQLTVILNMFLEPTIKVLMGRYGGLAAAGYFEMANKVVITLRSVITSAIQILVPVVSNMHESSPDRLSRMFIKSYELLLYLSLLFFTAIMLSIPFIAEILIGEYQPTFVEFAAMLTVGWFISTLSMSAFNFNLGTGHLRWNTISYLVMSLINPLLGIVLGKLFGGGGVVLSFVVTMIAGAAIVIVAFCRDHEIQMGKLFPLDSVKLVVMCVPIVLVEISGYMFYGDSGNRLVYLAIFCLFSLIIMWVVAKRHSQWASVMAVVETRVK